MPDAASVFNPTITRVRAFFDPYIDAFIVVPSNEHGTLVSPIFVTDPLAQLAEGEDAVYANFRRNIGLRVNHDAAQQLFDALHRSGMRPTPDPSTPPARPAPVATTLRAARPDLEQVLRAQGAHLADLRTITFHLLNAGPPPAQEVHVDPT